MYKLSIIVFVIAAICSCYGISNRRLIRSTSEISTEANPIIITDVNTPQDSAAAETSDITDIFTGIPNIFTIIQSNLHYKHVSV